MPPDSKSFCSRRRRPLAPSSSTGREGSQAFRARPFYYSVRGEASFCGDKGVAAYFDPGNFTAKGIEGIILLPLDDFNAQLLVLVTAVVLPVLRCSGRKGDNSRRSW